MRFPRFTASRDGVKRVDVRVTYRLDAHELVHVLATGRMRGLFPLLEEADDLPRSEVWMAIRATLQSIGETAVVLDDDEYREWAEEQVSKIAPWG